MAVYSSLVGNLKDLSMFNKVNKARVMVESGKKIGFWERRRENKFERKGKRKDVSLV